MRAVVLLGLGESNARVNDGLHDYKRSYLAALQPCRCINAEALIGNQPERVTVLERIKSMSSTRGHTRRNSIISPANTE
jgi:hypothetical protein